MYMLRFKIFCKNKITKIIIEDEVSIFAIFKSTLKENMKDGSVALIEEKDGLLHI